MEYFDSYSKFQPMSVGMRTAEVYLILAEAKARLKDIRELSKH